MNKLITLLLALVCLNLINVTTATAGPVPTLMTVEEAKAAGAMPSYAEDAPMIEKVWAIGCLVFSTVVLAVSLVAVLRYLRAEDVRAQEALFPGIKQDREVQPE